MHVVACDGVHIQQRLLLPHPREVDALRLQPPGLARLVRVEQVNLAGGGGRVQGLGARVWGLHTGLTRLVWIKQVNLGRGFRVLRGSGFEHSADQAC